MPKIQIQLCETGGATIQSPTVIESETVPLIGDHLDFTGCSALQCEDENERRTFVVTDVVLRWIDGRLVPDVTAKACAFPIDEVLWDDLFDCRPRRHAGELWPWRS